MGGQTVKMPEEGENFIKFKDIHKQLPLPYTIYADFECLLTKVQDNENKKTKKISRHDISGYGYAITSPFEKTEFKTYRGKDAGPIFMKNIMKEGARLQKKIKDANAPMIFGPEEEKEFQGATHCHICEKELPNGRVDHLSIIKPWVERMELDTRKIPTEKDLNKALKEFDAIRYTWNSMAVLNFNKKGKKVKIHMKRDRKIVKWTELKKTHEFQEFSDAMDVLKKYTKDNDCAVVRDHCHFTGAFRGAAHNHCNRQYRKTYNIPVFFHNLTGYSF